MFTHVTVGANDIEASRRFYDAALGALGVEPGQGPDPKGRYWWRTRMGAFAIGAPIDGEPACHPTAAQSAFTPRRPRWSRPSTTPASRPAVAPSRTRPANARAPSAP